MVRYSSSVNKSSIFIVYYFRLMDSDDEGEDDDKVKPTILHGKSLQISDPLKKALKDSTTELLPDKIVKKMLVVSFLLIPWFSNAALGPLIAGPELILHIKRNHLQQENNLYFKLGIFNSLLEPFQFGLLNGARLMRRLPFGSLSTQSW